MTSASPGPKVLVGGSASRRRATIDGVALAGCSFLITAGLMRLDAFERFAVWSRRYERWQIDELLVLGAVGSVATSVFAWRRWQDARRELAAAQRLEASLKRLEGLLPICSFCKRIRNRAGAWVDVEGYIMERADVHFSHGVCPGCTEDHYPDVMAD